MSRNGVVGFVAAAVAAFVAAFAVTSRRDDGVVAAGSSQPQPPSAIVGSNTNASSTGSVQDAIFALEKEWGRALEQRDTAAFRRITSPDFIYTEDNVVMSQDELVQAIATSPDTVVSATNTEMKLHDHNPTAIVTGIFVVKARSKGKPITNRYRFTDVWAYRDGKWQAIAAQDYLIPK